MIDQQLLSAYEKSRLLVSYHHRQLSKLMARIYLSFGVGTGLSLATLFLYGSDIEIPFAFLLLSGWSMIYAAVIAVLVYRFNCNVLLPATKEMEERWQDLFPENHTYYSLRTTEDQSDPLE